MGLIQADARMLPLVDGCVQCVVTSPPYFGLRDYGTATWEGGDPLCDHGVRRWDGPKQTQGAVSGHASSQDRIDRQSCHCGAIRIDRQIGLEQTPGDYVAALVGVFQEVRRVLKNDGVLWLNLGDSYATRWSSVRSEGGAGLRDDGRERHGAAPDGFKSKDLIGIPWRVAFALQADGWFLRSDVIWHKPNPMPESVTDRPTKAHEYLFLLTKSERYFYDAEAVKEEAVGKTLHDLTGQGYVAPGQAPNSGNRKALRSAVESRHRSQIEGGQSMQLEPDGRRNKRSVWTVPTMPYSGAHFATMPEKLVEPCVLAGSRLGDLVFDPFVGSGTVGVVAERFGRRWAGTDLSYQGLAKKRTAQRGLLAMVGLERT